MRLFIIILFSFIINTHIQSQIVGKVVDATNDSALLYASIGVINTRVGTITNEEGMFSLCVKGAEQESVVSFSMIGYKPVTLPLDKLVGKDNLIRLEPKPIPLDEVIVTSTNSEYREIGVTSHSSREICGWGGDKRGKGHEIGTKLDLGQPVSKIKELHFRIHKQSYDSCLFRLHIRNLKDGVPGEELIKDNILLTISVMSGWVDFDLSQYNILLNGEIAVTLEWIKVWGINKDNLVKMNKSKQKIDVALLSVKKKRGSLYVKRGVEAKWLTVDNQSPSIYLIVQ